MARYIPQIYEVNDDGSSRAQEDRVADVVDGHRQRGSGASDYAKGDVKMEEYLVECKTTGHASMSVKKSWLSKITKEALAVQKKPALSIEIQGDDDSVTPRDWICIPLEEFKRLIDKR